MAIGHKEVTYRTIYENIELMRAAVISLLQASCTERASSRVPERPIRILKLEIDFQKIISGLWIAFLLPSFKHF